MSTSRLIVFLCWALTSFSLGAQIIPESKLQEISQHPYWLKLLHYRTNYFGNQESFADGTFFFLSDSGKTNPRLELEKTIEAFHNPLQRVGKGSEDALCVFPERARFLSQELKINWRKVDCPAFNEWMAHFKNPKLTLIFASAFMNNPASTFGHTFLRVDNSMEEASEQKLLSYGLGFGADTTADLGLKVIIFGLFGGYQGYFSFSPYYQLLSEYHDHENRDLWEYELNISSSDVARMLTHVWELQQTYFDYFFFDENCSYHLLRLLEVAMPEEKLTSGRELWAIPTETVIQLSKISGIFGKVRGIHSSYKNLVERMNSLSESEQSQVEKYYQDKKLIGNESSTSLDFLIEKEKFERLKRGKSKDGLIRKRAYDFTQDTDINNHIMSESMRSLLVKRASILGPKKEIIKKELKNRPDWGHSAQKIGVGGGEWNHLPFYEFHYRPAFHDLTDNDRGHQAYSQVNIFNLEFRYFESLKNINLTQFEILNLVSLNPINRFEIPYSWSLEVGFIRPYELSCKQCLNKKVSGGMGHSADWLKQNGLLFYLVKLRLEEGDEINKRVRYGAELENTLLLNLWDRLKLKVSSQYTYFMNQKDWGYYLWNPQGTLSFSFNEIEMKFKWNKFFTKSQDYSDWQIALSTYF